MIFIITNKNDFTVDYFIDKIGSNDKNIFRFNTEDFQSKYILGYNNEYSNNSWYLRNKINSKEINSSNISGIWYRRPKFPEVKLDNISTKIKNSLSLEAKYTYEHILGSIDTNWMSYPTNIRKAENKILQSIVAKNIGFNVPSSIITNNPDEVINFKENFSEICLKPLRKGRYSDQENMYLIYNRILSQDDLAKIDNISNFPVLIQEYIPKKYELRVIVVNETVFTVVVYSQEKSRTSEDWRVDNCQNVKYEIINIPKEIETKCLKIVRHFGLNFSSMDIIVSEDGKYYFLDLNPNGQWGWLDEKLNLGISQKILEFLSNE